MCKKCKQMNDTDYYYRDVFCTIVGDRSELTCIYHWHKTPIQQHLKWMEQQLYIIATKMWNKQWGWKYCLTAEHPYIFAVPHRDIQAPLKSKVYDKKYKTREVE
jgi:hypothetical protein